MLCANQHCDLWCWTSVSTGPLLLFMDHLVYGCQNVHPGCAFNMELKRLKRDFFLSIIYLFLPRGIKVGSAVF